MQSWIEAAVAYLKQYTTLRFNMIWLFAWLTLLLIIPSEWRSFIDSKIGLFDISYTGTLIFLVPVSFFISLFIQWLAITSNNLFHSIQSKIKVNKAEKVILNLSEEEKALIVDIIDNGSYISDGDANETLMSLVYKEVIYSCQNTYSSEYKLTDFYNNVAVGLMVRTLDKK
ncbi:TPA: super-infection exclusion protein B [Yersinia enterocolitica]|nr:superinfection exclusion B family protein [Yersinia enterocolitica]